MYVGKLNEKTYTGENYTVAAIDRSVIEKDIGLSLAKNSALTNIAKTINEKAKIPTFDHSSRLGHPKMDLTDKLQIEGQRDSFGGARASAEGWDTLGRSVHEAMHVIEKDKAKYSEVQAGNTANPYFGRPESKKPEFDQPIADYKWEQLPWKIQSWLSDKHVLSQGKRLIKAYDTLSPSIRRDVILNDFRYENDFTNDRTINILSTGISQDIITSVKAIVADPKKDELRAIAKDLIIAKMKTLEGAGLSERDKQQKAQLAALLDIVVDKHTSGDHTNIVSRNGDGGVKDQWIADTVAAGKPIISGPSGHTLRYLNFWAEKRKKENEHGPIDADWPSLEAARLVMLADLLPPRHHSYDEVMTASMGIADTTGVNGNSLKYKHKSSYEDLNQHEDETAKVIAEKAFNESGASTIQSNTAIDGLMDRRNATIPTQLAEAMEHLRASIKEVPADKTTAALNKIKEAQQALQLLIHPSE